MTERIHVELTMKLEVHTYTVHTTDTYPKIKLKGNKGLYLAIDASSFFPSTTWRQDSTHVKKTPTKHQFSPSFSHTNALLTTMYQTCTCSLTHYYSTLYQYFKHCLTRKICQYTMKAFIYAFKLSKLLEAML